MKRIKAITAILLIIFTLFSNIGIFTASAEELSDAEREEIIETVRKSWWIYDAVAGVNDNINVVAHIDDKNLTEEEKKFLEYTSDIYPEEFEWISIGPPYYTDSYNKTKFKSKQELKDYIDTIFLNNTLDMDNIIYSCPRYLVYEDGYLYIYTQYTAVNFPPDWDFENIVDIRKNDGKVTVTLTNRHFPPPDLDTIYATAELKKVDGKWMVCGGSIFDQSWTEEYTEFKNIYKEEWFAHIYSPDAPQTGENTILYLAIATAALAAMTALVVRRKREVV